MPRLSPANEAAAPRGLASPAIMEVNETIPFPVTAP